MDLKVSYNWLSEYVDLKMSVSEFAKGFSLKSQNIERYYLMGKGLGGVVVGEIKQIDKHPNADKLSVAKVDIGKTGFLQVVFGQVATVKIGDKLPVAVAPIVLPNGQEIIKTELRGVESEGMFCLLPELGLSDSETPLFFEDNVKPGTSIVDAMNLNDYILEMEVTANRPDAMSVIGLAREASAVFGKKIKYQEPKIGNQPKQALPLKVTVKDKRCKRYMGVVLTDVVISPSPVWMQQKLLAAGLKPINNIVDITNYVMLELGQPLHAFDYEELVNSSIIVRSSNKGEKLVALDDSSHILSEGHLVIADSQKPVAIAGVIGGKDSSISGKTKTIVFEAACFDQVTVRKTARALKIKTDSSSLFEKGLQPAGTELGIKRAIQLAQQIAQAKLASKIIDVISFKEPKTKINFDTDDVSGYLGVIIPISKIKKMLISLGCQVSGNKKLSITVPWWRVGDLQEAHDIIEEIARLYGYSNIPSKLPEGRLPMGQADKQFFWENEIKQELYAIGFTEVYNYSMTSEKIVSRAGIDIKKMIEISNPLNDELRYMRVSLIPQLIEVLDRNQKIYPKQKLFELSNVYLVENKNDLPLEKQMIAGAILDSSTHPFYLIKGSVERLLHRLAVGQYEFIETVGSKPWSDQGLLEVFINKQLVGRFGIIASEVARDFGIEKSVAAFEFDFSLLSQFAREVKTFEPIAEYPSAIRDIAVLVDKDVKAAEVLKIIKNAEPDLVDEASYQDLFVDQKIGNNKKSLLFRVIFRSDKRTLETQEINDILKKIENDLMGLLNATMR